MNGQLATNPEILSGKVDEILLKIHVETICGQGYHWEWPMGLLLCTILFTAQTFLEKST